MKVKLVGDQSRISLSFFFYFVFFFLFFFFVVVFNSSFPDLSDSEVEITIIRGLNIPLPSGESCN